MYYFDSINGKRILRSTIIKDCDCFFTTREFVLTPKDRPDLEESALLNKKTLFEKFKVNKIYTAKQIHSSNISIVKENKTEYEDTDALITNIDNSVIMLNYADCVPIILYNKKNNIGSVIHAGWRGTESEITKKTVEIITKEMGTNPEEITALIGPAIGKCCFETDEEVFERLIKNRNQKELYEQKGNKYFIDLKLLNKYQLINSGVKNIDICDYCTCCMSDIFFSYRKEKGKTARHSAIIKIGETK